MERTVIEHPFFTRIKDALIEEHKLLEKDYEEFEMLLVRSPDSGEVIPGLSGLRKIRLKAANKGKRGGFRVDYLDLPEKGKLYLLIMYPKNVKPDLSPEEKKKIAKIVNQIKEKHHMGKMFEMMQEALLDVLEHERGNKKLPWKKVFIPSDPKDYTALDIKLLRSELQFSQRDFAAWLNVSLNTVQAWEQGVRHPNHSALRLLEILERDFPSIEKMYKTPFPKQVKRRKSKLPLKSKTSLC